MDKYRFSIWKENKDEWKLGLVTESYIFFCNFEESDENGNTRMYDRKMNLLSDNYFATQALMEEMENIYSKQVEVYYISTEIMEEIALREENGDYE